MNKPRFILLSLKVNVPADGTEEHENWYLSVLEDLGISTKQEEWRDLVIRPSEIQGMYDHGKYTIMYTKDANSFCIKEDVLTILKLIHGDKKTKRKKLKRKKGVIKADQGGGKNKKRDRPPVRRVHT